MIQPRSCPHCGKPVTEAQNFCPNCGTALGSARPPAPTLGEPLPPARPKTLTGRVWMDFVLGAAVQYFLHLATARALAYPTSDPTNLPNNEDTFFLVAEEILSAFVLGLVVYFVLRRFYPVVARGSGYATLLLLAVLLGALFICQPVTY